MKILCFLTLSATASTLLHTTSAKPGEHKFKIEGPPSHEGKRDHGRRGGFELAPIGGLLRLCPTGDCAQSIIDLKMERLVEVDANGNRTLNVADKFKEIDANWSTPITALNTEGVNVTTSSFNTLVPVDNANKNVNFKAEIAFFHANGTTLNGKQVVDVPGGSLKFAIWIDDWPFLADTNKLRFGVHVMKRNRRGDKLPKALKRGGHGRDKKIERVDLDDAGMFLDSPVVAQIDNEMKNITSFVKTEGEAVLIEYEFPKFKNLFYDPVLGSTEDASTDDANLRSEAAGTVKSLVTMSLTVAAVMMFWL